MAKTHAGRLALVTGATRGLGRAIAERLRDDILRSKLTHPDPWTYGAKARAWGERAQALVEEIAVEGDTPATRRLRDYLVAVRRPAVRPTA